jgi:hypothetical protein
VKSRFVTKTIDYNNVWNATLTEIPPLNNGNGDFSGGKSVFRENGLCRSIWINHTLFDHRLKCWIWTASVTVRIFDGWLLDPDLSCIKFVEIVSTELGFCRFCHPGVPVWSGKLFTSDSQEIFPQCLICKILSMDFIAFFRCTSFRYWKNWILNIRSLIICILEHPSSCSFFVESDS